jgi:O-Antigen ligase
MQQVSRFPTREARDLWGIGVALLAAIALGTMSLAFGVNLTYVVGGLAGLVLLGLTTWKPVVALAVLVVAVPMTAGLGRNTVIPLLRTNEAMTAVIVVGMVIHTLPQGRRRGYSGLDLAVLTFVSGAVLVPWAVLNLGRTDVDLSTWQTVLAPVQYLLIYFLFSRVEMSSGARRWLINLTLVCSVVVALIGVAQLADLPGVRDFIATYYPGNVANICQFGVCRPTSLLEHWSSFGAYAVLNFAVALAIAATPGAGYNSRWLTLVMAANAVAVLASQTQAAVGGLLLVIVVIMLHRRRLPRQLLPTIAALAIGVAAFWPQVSARVEQQLGTAALGTPESLQTRIGYWNQLFVPVFLEHPWFGSGTVISTEVPPRLTLFVDNEYLGMGFRAGFAGEALLLLMFGAVLVTAWRSRGSPVPMAAAIGAASAAFVVALAVMGMTAEYLTFAGVAEAFWIVVGLMGWFLIHPVAAPDVTPTPRSSPPGQPNAPTSK